MNLNSLVEEFARHVAAQTDAIWNGNARVGNREAKLYISAFKKIREQGEEGRDALAELLKHPRMDVRVRAAIYLLANRPTQAIPILEDAARGEGMLAFEASAVLKYWNEGTWSLDIA